MAISLTLASNQWVDLGGGLTVWTQQTQGTLMAWFTPQTLPSGSTSHVVSYSTGISTTGPRFSIYYTNGMELRANSRGIDAGATFETTAGVIALGTQYHVAAVCGWASQTFDLYLNGVLVDSTAPAAWTVPQSNTNSLQGAIGARPDGAVSRAGALISEIRAYRRSLPAAEIQTIYRSRGKDSIRQGLYHRYLTNEGANGAVMPGGQVIKDSGIGKVDGSPVNSPIWSTDSLSYRSESFVTQGG